MRGDDPSKGRIPGKQIAADQHGRRIVRIDPAFGVTSVTGREATLSRGGLIERLRRAIQLSASDRRKMVRHDVADREIWVAWWVGDEFGAVPGRLVNLSRSGAMVVLGDRPPRDQPVWFYKEVDGVLTCVRGELVGMIPAPAAGYRARFRFASPCPISLCEAALCRPPEPDRSPHRSDTEPRSS
jgi:hypothetical protein